MWVGFVYPVIFLRYWWQFIKELIESHFLFAVFLFFSWFVNWSCKRCVFGAASHAVAAIILLSCYVWRIQLFTTFFDNDSVLYAGFAWIGSLICFHQSTSRILLCTVSCDSHQPCVVSCLAGLWKKLHKYVKVCELLSTKVRVNFWNKYCDNPLFFSLINVSLFFAISWDRFKYFRLWAALEYECGTGLVIIPIFTNCSHWKLLFSQRSTCFYFLKPTWATFESQESEVVCGSPFDY